MPVLDLVDDFRVGSSQVAKIYAGTNLVWELAAAATFTWDEMVIHGGGTHNHVVYSPDGTRIAAFGDVGGTRRWTSAGGWEYLPLTDNPDADRQVAGGLILNDGTVFALVGNGDSSGRLLEYAPNGTITVLIDTGLNVHGNSTTSAAGASGARPRPVGWMLLYDSTNDLIYVCEDDDGGAGDPGGIVRYNRDTSTNDGRIALDGIGCLGFTHANDGVVADADTLFVSTRTAGLVKLFDVQNTPVAIRVSDQAWSRVEDSAVVSGEKALCACYEDGAYRYDATGYVSLNGSQDIDGPSVDVVVSSQDFVIAVELDCTWATDVFDIFNNWDTAGAASTQQHRFDLTSGGILRYRCRDAVDGLGQATASAATTLTGRGWVRFRRAAGSNDAFFEESTDGVTWTQIGTTISISATVPTKTQNWSLGGTQNGNGQAPSGTLFYRALVEANGTQLVSFDATGLVSGATTYTSLEGDSWTLNGTVTAGGVEVTAGTGTGSNGGTIRFLGAAAIDDAGTVTGALGVVNPLNADEWIYRAANVETVTTTWDDGTPTIATQAAGSSYLSPENRVLGASGASGADLTGVYNLCFNPTDPDELLATACLSLYRTSTWTGTITWATFNDGLSMLSIPDVHVDANGDVWWAASDHNSLYLAGENVPGTEPGQGSVSGLGDAWSMSSVGSGADRVVVFCPVNDGGATADRDDADNDVFFHEGDTFPTGGWTTTGYDGTATPIGRACGSFGWDNGDGTYTWVVYSDGDGYRRATYTLATNTWSAWTLASTGPTTSTAGQNQEQQIVGAADGSVLFGIIFSTGDIWRSTDGGTNWTNIATSIGASEQRRKGRIAYNETDDWLAVSDDDGLHRIDDASTTASVTTLTGVTAVGPVAVDSSGRLYCHTHESGSVQLLRFASFDTATATTDGTDIASTGYKTRVGQLANNMDIGPVDGTERGFTTYQGAGSVTWVVPT